MTKQKSVNMNTPVWFDGTNINEALFCDDFLSHRKIIFANGAFFTPDGRVTDDLPLRGEIYEELKCCAVNNIPRKITNILEVMKLAAHVEDFPPETDRIHLANGTLKLDGSFTEGRPDIVRSRLPVAYCPDAPAPTRWFSFLEGLLYAEDIPTFQFNRSDIMEILRTQQKTEMVKEVKGWTFPVGVVFTVLGILLGAGLPQIAAKKWGIGLPEIVNLFYLLSCGNLFYAFVCSVTEQNKEKQEKYYGNLVSISLMRFAWKSDNKEYVCYDASYFCVRLFRFLRNAVYTFRRRDRDGRTARIFLFTIRLLKIRLEKEEIYNTASSYGIEVTDFTGNRRQILWFLTMPKILTRRQAE